MISQKVMDPNQTAAFTREQWLKWRAAGLTDAESKDVYARLKTMKHTPIADKAAGLPAWTAFDVSAGEIARESIARHPVQRWKTAGISGVRLLALWNLPHLSENYYWSVLMRSIAKHKSTHSIPRELYAPGPLISEVYSRTAMDATGWMCGPEGRAFAKMYDLLAMARPLWSWLYLAGLLVLALRKQWGLLAVGVIPLVHAAALSVLLLDGIDRYQAPLFPLMSVVACFGLAALAARVRAWRFVPAPTTVGPITTPPPPPPPAR
jgi:hypothetical protein